jgi:type VI secretion system secreted protein Hcp
MGQRVEGHDDEILVWAFDYSVKTPTDIASGQPTGTRVHSPVVITKQFDKSSPLIYRALTTGEILKEVIIKFYRVEGAAEEEFFHITLEKAIVTEINAWKPNFQDPAQAHLQQMEKVSFNFRKITWNHLKGKTDSSDSWEQKV